MANLNPEEAAALRELMQPAGGSAAVRAVAARNFAEPRRLSAARLQRIARQVGAQLGELSHELAVSLRTYPKITIGQVGELNARGLFREREAPFLVYQFEHAGNVVWLVWDSAAAVAATETILAGEMQGEPRARRLSQAECRVVRRLLAQVTRHVMNALGLAFDESQASVAQEREELVTLEDKGIDSDSQRLLVHLVFDGPGGASDLRLYVPGITPESAAGAAPALAQLPGHLSEVVLELCAFLGAVDVPLTDLLDLEVGDVIPLGVPIDARLEVYVEDRACGKGRWGRKGDHLAVLLEELSPHPSTIEDPEPSDRP